MFSVVWWDPNKGKVMKDGFKSYLEARGWAVKKMPPTFSWCIEYN